MTKADWTTIEALPSPRLESLFAEDAARLASFSVDVAGLHFDWSKTHLTADAVAAFTALAKAQDLHGKREALFAGEAVNTSEGRAVDVRHDRDLIAAVLAAQRIDQQIGPERGATDPDVQHMADLAERPGLDRVDQRAHPGVQHARLGDIVFAAFAAFGDMRDGAALAGANSPSVRSARSM